MRQKHHALAAKCSQGGSAYSSAPIRQSHCSRKEKSAPVGMGCGRPWIDQWRPGRCHCLGPACHPLPLHVATHTMRCRQRAAKEESQSLQQQLNSLAAAVTPCFSHLHATKHSLSIASKRKSATLQRQLHTIPAHVMCQVAYMQHNFHVLNLATGLAVAARTCLLLCNVQYMKASQLLRSLLLTPSTCLWQALYALALNCRAQVAACISQCVACIIAHAWTAW